MAAGADTSFMATDDAQLSHPPVRGLRRSGHRSLSIMTAMSRNGPLTSTPPLPADSDVRACGTKVNLPRPCPSNEPKLCERSPHGYRGPMGRGNR